MMDCDNHISLTLESEIHQLLGGDVPRKILNGKIQWMPCGPVAVGADLKWIFMTKIPQVLLVTESYII